MWSNTVNTQYRANHVLVRFCPWEDFIPGRIQSFDLSLHYCKHSTISSFVFFNFFVVGGFCPNNNSTIFYVHHYGKHTYRSSFVFWGDFVPTTILSYSMYTITVNTHIDQVLYFWGILYWGILFRQQFCRILCTPLQ